MAGRKLILSPRAHGDRRLILTYWRQRNQSNTFSKRLDEFFRKTFDSIIQHPESGQLIREGVRSKIIKGYRIAYQIFPAEIIVVRI